MVRVSHTRAIRAYDGWADSDELNKILAGSELLIALPAVNMTLKCNI